MLLLACCCFFFFCCLLFAVAVVVVCVCVCVLWFEELLEALPLLSVSFLSFSHLFFIPSFEGRQKGKKKVNYFLTIEQCVCGALLAHECEYKSHHTHFSSFGARSAISKVMFCHTFVRMFSSNFFPTFDRMYGEII